MSDYIQEKVKEAKRKFVEPVDKDMRVIDANGEKYIFGKWSDLSYFLTSSLQEMEERTKKNLLEELKQKGVIKNYQLASQGSEV